jgi:recombination protein RecA
MEDSMAPKKKQASVDDAPKLAADASKEDRFAAAMEQMRKKHGKEAISTFGEDESNVSLEVKPLPTGLLPVDRATGIGGVPKGRVIEIYGPESSGKTTVCLHTIKQLQMAGEFPVYVDLENALSGTHLTNIGIRNLTILNPDSAEHALNMLEDLSKAGICLTVVDSVSAMSPEGEQEKDIGQQQPGRVAALMSETLRRIVGINGKTGATTMFINQIRMKIGVSYGNPETTSGGNALKFYSSMRMDLRKIETLKTGDVSYANRVRLKIVKNKVAPPFTEEEFVLYYDAKKTEAANVIEVGSKIGIIDKSGTWYSYNGDRLGQGLANSVEFLISNPALLNEIYGLCVKPENLFKKAVVVKDDVL